MQKQKIILINEFHLDNPVVSLVFEKDATLINKVKTLPGARWSQSRKEYYDIERPGKESHLPDVLSKKEVKRPLNNRNFKNPLDDLL